MKLKKELRAVKEINEQERKKRDEPGEKQFFLLETRLRGDFTIGLGLGCYETSQIMSKFLTI